MSYTHSMQLQEYVIGPLRMKLYAPDPQKVKEAWKAQQAAGDASPFPYWTQVWPAALAMAEFLVKNPEYAKGKEILELAAGLGLPSLTAAEKAKKICCSDYLPEAVETVQMSVEYNQLKNVDCHLLNWNELPDDLQPEVVLLSDINYDPSGFDVLYEVIGNFLQAKAMVILTTPQRLMGVPFINRLLPWSIRNEEMIVAHNGRPVAVTLLVLALQS